MLLLSSEGVLVFANILFICPALFMPTYIEALFPLGKQDMLILTPEGALVFCHFIYHQTDGLLYVLLDRFGTVH